MAKLPCVSIKELCVGFCGKRVFRRKSSSANCSTPFVSAFIAAQMRTLTAIIYPGETGRWMVAYKQRRWAVSSSIEHFTLGRGGAVGNSVTLLVQEQSSDRGARRDAERSTRDACATHFVASPQRVATTQKS